MSQSLQTVKLPDTGRVTTRLGYGCSSLMGALGTRESHALLDAAYEAGIRHFDVAPMYGYGAAEGCLGSFLSRRPGDTTVTTKYGIAPVKNHSLMGLARRIVGPLVQRVPSLKSRMAAAAGAVAKPAEKATFTAEQAQQSLEKSLKALEVERIDLWLLHEVEAADLESDELLRFLEDAVASGKIGTFGVGSDRYKVEELLRERPAYCRVLQHEWSVMDAAVPEAGPFRIHHRALTEHFHALRGALKQDAAMWQRWSQEVGEDLAHKEMLANLMLKAAFALNPTGIVLASSKNPGHIAANACVVANDALTEPAKKLYALVQREGVAAKDAIAEVAA